jgi:thiol-disulfide isomerase/thioredoxin
MKFQKNTKFDMKTLKLLSLLLVFFFCISNGQMEVAAKSAENNTTTQQSSIDQSLIKLSPVDILQKMTQAQLEGKYVYLLFYETGNSDCDVMKKRIDDVAQKTVEKLEVFKIDRKNPDYRTIVNSMRVQTAPIPLTLLRAPNGKVVKSFTKAVTVEELLSAFPSPKKIQAMALLQEGKSIIFNFSKQDMPSETDIQSRCEAAKEKLNGKTAYIKVDMSDPKEEGFIKEMKINTDSHEPVTIVINAKGQITGKYMGEIKVDDLVLAATKVATGGCCPSGSEKSCGPKK